MVNWAMVVASRWRLHDRLVASCRDANVTSIDLPNTPRWLETLGWNREREGINSTNIINIVNVAISPHRVLRGNPLLAPVEPLARNPTQCIVWLACNVGYLFSSLRFLLASELAKESHIYANDRSVCAKLSHFMANVGTPAPAWPHFCFF